MRRELSDNLMCDGQDEPSMQTGLTDTERLYLEFWESFKEVCPVREPAAVLAKARATALVSIRPWVGRLCRIAYRQN
jgi:hypothetical protein